MSDNLIKELLIADNFLTLIDNQVQAYKKAQDANPNKKLSGDDLGGLEKAARIFNTLRASARQDGKYQQFGNMDDSSLEQTIADLEKQNA